MQWTGRRAATVLFYLAAVVITLVTVTGAFANVTPSITTSLTLDKVVPTGITGATTTVTVPAVKLGQHSDLTVDMGFGYGATGTVSLGNGYGVTGDPATTPDWRSSLESLVVDIPPGLVGNPNAIPFDERCPMQTFLTGLCPESATVGEFTIKTVIMGYEEDPDFYPPEIGDDYIGATITPRLRNQGFTRVSLLQSSPEVPALIGVYVLPWFQLGGPILTVLKIEPDTNGDLRLRTTTPDDITDRLISRPTDDPPNTVMARLRIDRMTLKLWGRLKNGRAFMTNPTSCRLWTSKIWARANLDNGNLDSDPLGQGSPQFAEGNETSIVPDCTNQEDVPFPIKGDVSISTPDRNTSPAFDFTIDNPGVQSDGEDVASSPRKIVTTIPAAINVDVGQLGRVCQVADFDADTCPATSRVGSVKIETPLLLPGLSGDVYLVKQAGSGGLPDLGLRMRGAISFTQRGVNKYVGADFNQIQTTFDEIPQIGFSKLTFHLDGGPDGLLRSAACPSMNKTPKASTFTYEFTAWNGARATSTTPLNMANCFGVQELRPYKRCLKSVLAVHPNYASRSRLDYVRLYVDGKLVRTRKYVPYRFDVRLKKIKKQLKKGKKHRFEVRAVYDDGTVSKKQVGFRTCKDWRRR
jgi:hypothetical protein